MINATQRTTHAMQHITADADAENNFNDLTSRSNTRQHLMKYEVENEMCSKNIARIDHCFLLFHFIFHRILLHTLLFSASYFIVFCFIFHCENSREIDNNWNDFWLTTAIKPADY